MVEFFILLFGFALMFTGLGVAGVMVDMFLKEWKNNKEVTENEKENGQ